MTVFWRQRDAILAGKKATGFARYFRRLRAALVCIDDVDRDYLLEMAAGGVEIGVDRVPAVFEEKTKWPLEAVDAELEEQIAENYESAKLSMEQIRHQVEAEMEKGMILRMSQSEAEKELTGGWQWRP